MKQTRMDRNVLDNLTLFDREFASDSSLIKSFLILLAYDVQYNIFPENLWGLKQIDPYVVAKLLRQSDRHLINKHTNPQQFRGMSEIELIEFKAESESKGIPLWDSNLDNVIYILMSQNNITVQGGSDKAVQFGALISNGFLQTAQKYQLPNKSRPKILYETKLRTEFKHNLACNFSRFDFDLFVNLSPKSRNMYLSLINMREKVFRYQKQGGESVHPKEVEINPFFTLLKQWANTSAKAIRESRRSINEKFSEINRVAGYVMINADISDEHNVRIMMTYSDQEIAQRQQEVADRLKVFLRLNLQDAYRMMDKHKPTDKDTIDGYELKMKNWFKDDNADYPLKNLVVKDTLRLVYGEKHSNNQDSIFKTFGMIKGLADRISPEVKLIS